MSEKIVGLFSEQIHFSFLGCQPGCKAVCGTLRREKNGKVSKDPSFGCDPRDKGLFCDVLLIT